MPKDWVKDWMLDYFASLFAKCRTEAVLNLCQNMRQTQDFSLLPILADAVDEAGFPVEEVTDRMRETKEWSEQCAWVSMFYSQESVKAVLWMQNFLNQINHYEERHSFDYILKMAREALSGKNEEGVFQEGSHGMFFGSDAGADYFREGEHNVREFFLNWSLITGINAPEEEQDKIHYSCAC